MIWIPSQNRLDGCLISSPLFFFSFTVALQQVSLAAEKARQIRKTTVHKANRRHTHTYIRIHSLTTHTYLYGSQTHHTPVGNRKPRNRNLTRTRLHIHIHTHHEQHTRHNTHQTSHMTQHSTQHTSHTLQSKHTTSCRCSCGLCGWSDGQVSAHS